MIRHSNAYGAIKVLVIVAILLMGMWVMMTPFAKIFTKFAEPHDNVTYPTNTSCWDSNKHWYNNACYEIPERANSTIHSTRRVWLIAPIIFIIGLIWWYITVSTSKDPQHFQRPPGGFP